MLFEFIRLGDPHGQRKAKSHAVKHACRERRARDAENFRRRSNRRDEPLRVDGPLDEAGQIESLLHWQVGSQLWGRHPPKPRCDVEALSTPSEGEPPEKDAIHLDLGNTSWDTLVSEPVTRSGIETPKVLSMLGGAGECEISRLSRTDQYLLKWSKSGSHFNDGLRRMIPLHLITTNILLITR
jgi:hypothetical protein